MKTKYKDYVTLYNSKPCVLLRKILEKRDCSNSGIRYPHNDVIRYFNKEALHVKYTENEFTLLMRENLFSKRSIRRIFLSSRVGTLFYDILRFLFCGYSQYSNLINAYLTNNVGFP